MKIIFFLLLLAITCEAAPRRKDLTCREKAINETLIMTLVVGSEFREQGKKPTWAELQTEIARRLKKSRK